VVDPKHPKEQTLLEEHIQVMAGVMAGLVVLAVIVMELGVAAAVRGVTLVTGVTGVIRDVMVEALAQVVVLEARMEALVAMVAHPMAAAG
jgi:hypothetical protein